ncbi:hypothetical protein DFJ77DRAFT_63389 [Powellomyces hirtus]|nr:hypothetical protein DFJ77DRAFT_63389 [Powellomyces hirtus]
MAVQLDTSDPKILATYEEIRGESGSADWMILAVAPRLPGATKDIVNVLESGVGGLDEFQQHVGTAAFTGYGYVKHENKFVFAEILPEQLGGADRTLAKKYAKQIMAVLPEHDSTMVVTTGTDKAESPLMHPSIDASGVRKRAPSETSQSSAMFQGKMALSATSLTSELDTSHEDHLKRIRENTISKERYKEEVERKLKVIADQR